MLERELANVRSSRSGKLEDRRDDAGRAAAGAGGRAGRRASSRSSELTAPQQQLGRGAASQRASSSPPPRVLLGQIQEKQLASQQQVQRQTAAKAELAAADRADRQVAPRPSPPAAAASSASSEAASDAEAQLVEQQETLADADRRRWRARSARPATSVKRSPSSVEALRGEHARDRAGAARARAASTASCACASKRSSSARWTSCSSTCPHRYAEPHEDDGPATSPADMDWDAVAEEIKELREKIQRLGNVNLDAIGEQDELEQRSSSSPTQVTDLTDSQAAARSS